MDDDGTGDGDGGLDVLHDLLPFLLSSSSSSTSLLLSWGWGLSSSPGQVFSSPSPSLLARTQEEEGYDQGPRGLAGEDARTTDDDGVRLLLRAAAFVGP